MYNAQSHPGTVHAAQLWFGVALPLETLELVHIVLTLDLFWVRCTFSEAVTRVSKNGQIKKVLYCLHVGITKYCHAAIPFFFLQTKKLRWLDAYSDSLLTLIATDREQL